MNKKLLLAGLMVSVMGLSSLVAEDKEEMKVESPTCLSCDTSQTEEEVSLSAQEEEQISLSVQEEEDQEVKALSCGDCKLTEDDETQESTLS